MVNSKHCLVILVISVLSTIFIISTYIIFPSFHTKVISQYCGRFEGLSGSPLSTPSDNTEKKNLLYVFLSIGTKQERNEMIRQNIEHIVTKNKDNTKYRISCLLYGYASYENQPQWVKDMEKLQKPTCEYVKVYNQSYVYFLKSISPFFVDHGRFDYVTIVLDDVVHYEPFGNVDIIQYFDIIYQNNLGMASPAIKGSPWSPSLGPRPVDNSINQVGRQVRMIELQAATFRADVWRCLFELIDTQFPSGWGIDIWYYDYCVTSGKVKNGIMAIIDTMVIHHNPLNFPTTHVVASATALQVKHFSEVKGVQLKETMPGEGIGLIFFNKQVSV